METFTANDKRASNFEYTFRSGGEDKWTELLVAEFYTDSPAIVFASYYFLRNGALGNRQRGRKHTLTVKKSRNGYFIVWRGRRWYLRDGYAKHTQEV